MDIRNSYWKLMAKVKFDCFYILLHYNHSLRWDKRTNIFLAIMSGSTIAGWAFWEKYKFLWVLLLTLFQIINVIEPYLPYSTRVEQLFEYKCELNDLYLKIERNWIRITKEEYTETEIIDLIYGYKEKLNDFEKKYMKGDFLKNKHIIKETAREQTEEYMKNILGGIKHAED